MAVTLDPSDLLRRVHRAVERSVLRGRNGLRYLAGSSRPRVGATAKATVWRRDKAQLWHYEADGPHIGPPLVIVHSLISRSYIFDLLPANSVVRTLGAAGLDVFLLDWGEPDESDAGNTLETYVDEYLPRALAAACDTAGSEDVTVMGYCLGGLLSLLAAAAHPDLPVRNIATLAAPVGFADLGVVVGLLRDGRLDPEHVIDETGNVPAEAIYDLFRAMRPTDPVVQYANLWQNLWNDRFVESFQGMGQWTRDHVPFPGRVLRQSVDQLVRGDALVNDSLRLGGRRVSLADIRQPLLAAMATNDNIVPIAAAEPLPQLVGSDDVEELRIDAGHVGLLIGRHAAKQTLPRLIDWIHRHSDPEPR